MKQLFSRLLLLTATFFFSSLTTYGAISNFRNIPRLIRVGLRSQGYPYKFTITPTTGFIEIFDNLNKSAVYSGKAQKIVVKCVKHRKMKVTIDKKKNFYYFKGELIFSPIGRAPNYLKLKGKKRKSYFYRGSIIVKPHSLKSLEAINLIDIEDYLKSVVPSEIYCKSPIATLEAQAIAARTYAVRNISRHSKHHFNVCDTVHCQAYKGVVKEIPASSKAVKNTEGKILIYDWKPANTVYHSNCGGIIKSSKCAWGGKSVKYLVSHRDGIKGKKLFCDIGKAFKKRKKFGKIQKPVKNLIVRSYKWNYRKKLHHSFGHRVGMCQDGAIGMGVIGYNFWKILGFYYPGTRLITLNYARSRKSLRSHLPKNISKKINKLNSKLPALEMSKSSELINPTQKMAIYRTLLTKRAPKISSVKAALSEIYMSNKKNHKTTVTGLIRFRKLFWYPTNPISYGKTKKFK